MCHFDTSTIAKLIVAHVPDMFGLVNALAGERPEKSIQSAFCRDSGPTTIRDGERVGCPVECGDGVTVKSHGGGHAVMFDTRVTQIHGLAVPDGVDHLLFDNSHGYAFLVEGAIITSL